jgi:hypothetical protein
LDEWNVGRMECWKNGMMEYGIQYPESGIPHPIIPILHYSIIPCAAE